MLAEAAPVVRPAVGGKSVELLSQALLITAVPAALGPADYGTLALMLGVATVASSALALGGPAAVALVVGGVPPGRRVATARALAIRGLAWRQLAVLVAWGIALAAGAPPAAATLLALAAALDGAATTAAQATLAVGRPWGFALRWPVQNLALVVAALALRPGSAATAAAEDRDLCARAVGLGMRVVLVDEAGVSHHRPSGPSQLWRQYVEYGRGAHRLDRLRASAGQRPVRAGTGFPAALTRSALRATRTAHSPLVIPLVGLTQVATAWGYATLGPSRPV